jgi:hypothetical protein
MGSVWLGNIIFVSILGLLFLPSMADEKSSIGWRLGGLFFGAIGGLIVGLVSYIFSGFPRFISIIWCILFTLVGFFVVFVPDDKEDDNS